MKKRESCFSTYRELQNAKVRRAENGGTWPASWLLIHAEGIFNIKTKKKLFNTALDIFFGRILGILFGLLGTWPAR